MWQPIAPASGEPGQHRATPDTRKRRQAVAVACLQCRSGKAKCDGFRPRCTRCGELELSCQYDVPEGVSRAERMKILKRDSISGRAEEMERVIRALRTSSDVESTSILARLRIGERLDLLAQSLPPILASPVRSKPPSLPGQNSQDSVGSSESGLSFSDISLYSYHLPPRASFSPSIVHPSSNWSASQLSVPPEKAPSRKGKQLAITTESGKPPFLSILFDREDYLLAFSDSEDENEPHDGVEGIIDPRLLETTPGHPLAGASTGFLMDVTSAHTQSPQKDHFAGSHGITHLSNRQAVVNTLRIHPNYNLRNVFGNMAFSSSVRTNNHPADVQEAQVNNLFIPTWAMMTVNTRPDPGSLKHAFYDLQRQVTNLIDSGKPMEDLIEIHPNIPALFDEDEYNKSGLLSKWAAGMVHSAQLKGNDFTAYASMYLFWYLMRWELWPSPETYETMPEWLRPTPNQLFMPHTNMLGFVPWPAFREYAVQIRELQERMEWLKDMCNTIRCDWFLTNDEAFTRNDKTGQLELCDTAKTVLRDLSNWSVGPSFRQYIANADSYVRIRTEEL